VLVEKLIAYILIVVVLNVPFGSYRLLTRKFSLGWFLAIHLPIPFIIVLRSLAFRLPLWVIPISLISAVAGQLLGGMAPRCGQGVRKLVFRQTSPA
jgi:hypothetical protein